ncbi:MAG TPA: hypothetical protein VFS02_00555 [Telluria sp.]|nr:hypothetical protein [Telluria sp.]
MQVNKSREAHYIGMGRRILCETVIIAEMDNKTQAMARDRLVSRQTAPPPAVLLEAKATLVTRHPTAAICICTNLLCADSILVHNSGHRIAL